MKIETAEEFAVAFFQAQETTGVALDRRGLVEEAVRVRDRCIAEELKAKATALIEQAKVAPDQFIGGHLSSQAQALKDFAALLDRDIPAAREVVTPRRPKNEPEADCG